MSDKPVIAVDLDDVVQPYQHPLFSAHVERFTGDEYPYEAHVSMHLAEVLPHITVEQELAIVHQVYDDPDFWGLLPYDNCYSSLSSLADHFTIVGVTSRPQSIADKTKQWLDQHLPNVFTDVIHVGLRSTAENKVTKLQIALELEAVAMIDDTRYHLLGCSDNGILGILVDHPWNRQEPEHPDFVRVSGWEEIYVRLLLLVPIY